MIYQTIILGLVLASQAQATSGGNNVVVYWGQNSSGNEQGLAHYCDNPLVDVVNVSFLSKFNGVDPPTINLSKHCGGATCPEISRDIKHCQSKGKKVLLSIGGATSDYGLADTKAAETLADQLHSGYFGGGGSNSSAVRVFGDAKLDGVDLDLENKLPANYGGLVKRLRELQPDLMVTAAPQCPFKDESVQEAMESGPKFDFVSVQFYNNPGCNIDGKGFNFNVWSEWAAKFDTKIVVGVLGSPAMAGTGFIALDDLKLKFSRIKDDPRFGGVMMWDASHVFGTTASAETAYGESVAKLIKDL